MIPHSILMVVDFPDPFGPVTARAVRHRIKAGTLVATKLGPGTAAYVIARSEIERVKAAA